MLFKTIGSLSTRVFETRTATGSELFSLLACPHTTTFTLLSMFSPLEMNSIKIWETIRSKNANCSLPVAVRASKTRVLKLPDIFAPNVAPTGQSRTRLADWVASDACAIVFQLCRVQHEEWRAKGERGLVRGLRTSFYPTILLPYFIFFLSVFPPLLPN